MRLAAAAHRRSEHAETDDNHPPGRRLGHVLLLPSFYVLLAVGFWLMRYASKTDDWDSTMGSPIIVAVPIMISTMTVYYVGSILRKSGRPRGEVERK